MIPQSDTVWTKTPFANLYRYKDGNYHCRAKVHGQLVRQSLKTKSLEIAKTKLDELLGVERERLAREPDGEGSFGSIVQAYLASIAADSDLKPRAKAYRKETVAQLKKTAPELWTMPVAALDSDTCKTVSDKLREAYSPTRYNGAMQTLRAICELAIDSGHLARNPTRELKSIRVPVMPPEIPEADGFKRLLRFLDAHPNRRVGANLVRLLAYSGCRIGAARLIMPAHVDFKNKELLIPAIKYDPAPTRLPMFPHLEKLLRRMVRAYPGAGPLVQIHSPKRTLKKCCELAKIAPITPHHLRHLFATRCIESGVDIKTVAEWLGHKDGGALLLKRYAHLRRDHSRRMAEKVKW